MRRARIDNRQAYGNENDFAIRMIHDVYPDDDLRTYQYIRKRHHGRMGYVAMHAGMVIVALFVSSTAAPNA